MRLSTLAAACTIGLMAAIPAAAAGPQIAQNETKSNDATIICKNLYHQGSMVRDKRDCKTSSQWNASHEKERYRTKQAIEDMQTRALTKPPR